MGKIFTRERMIYGAVMSIIGLFGTIYTTRIQASSQVNQSLNDFKLEVAKEVGGVEGDVQTLKALNPEINRRLENIEGSIQTLNSTMMRIANK